MTACVSCDASESAEGPKRLKWRDELGTERSYAETDYGTYLVDRTPVAQTFQGFGLWWFPSSTPTHGHHLGLFPTSKAAKAAARKHLNEVQAGPAPPAPAPSYAPARAGERDPRNPSEIFARIRARSREAGPIRNPAYAAWVLQPMSFEPQEIAVVMSLNVHGYVREVREVARGAVEHTDVDLPMAIRAMSVAGTYWGMLAHNHPSTSAEPSKADAKLWHDARARFACAGLALFDHLVIARREFYSFAWGGLYQLPR